MRTPRLLFWTVEPRLERVTPFGLQHQKHKLVVIFFHMELPAVPRRESSLRGFISLSTQTSQHRFVRRDALLVHLLHAYLKIQGSDYSKASYAKQLKVLVSICDSLESSARNLWISERFGQLRKGSSLAIGGI